VPLIDGGTQRLPRVVGLGRTLDITLTGRTGGDEEVLAIGLVTELVEPGRHVERALDSRRRWPPSPSRPCSPAAPSTASSDDPAEFMKGFVKQSIDREFGSKPASVSCKYLGKEEVALAPDSWNYDCAATMADGKKYIDKVICFDALR